MKALLMHRDRDFDRMKEPPAQAEALVQDLELGTLVNAMAGEDEFLAEVAHAALVAGAHGDLVTIRHRQEVLRDCLDHPAIVRELYALMVEAIASRKGHYFGIISRYPTGVLRGAIDLMATFADHLWALRKFADTHASQFRSEGFTALFAMLQHEFSDAYLERIQKHLAELRFPHGILLSAALGKGNAITQYTLRQRHQTKANWFARLFTKGPSGYTFHLHERDESGARILSEMCDRGINEAANALAQAVDHILAFFEMLRAELAFYVGALNLHDRLVSIGVPIVVPIVVPQPSAPEAGFRLSGHELCDVCLGLAMGHGVVGNTFDASGKRVVIITGANQGGKSSFLRGIGLAHVMMQAGLFVAAESFTADLCADLFTHYKREEDAALESGKFDEEISRMSDIAELIRPHSLALFNESFASTNEREGSDIAAQIVRGLCGKQIRVVFVTHLYEFAHGMFEQALPDALFLRAERREDGTRTFRLVEGEPLRTSYGEDLYHKVFASGAAAEVHESAR